MLSSSKNSENLNFSTVHSRKFKFSEFLLDDNNATLNCFYFTVFCTVVVFGIGTQQVELNLSYATSCKKVYQRYKAMHYVHMDKIKP